MPRPKSEKTKMRNKEKFTTEELIATAKSKLEELTGEKANIEAKIKETKARIAELETRLEIEKLSDINSLAKANNVTLNQLLDYLRSGGINNISPNAPVTNTPDADNAEEPEPAEPVSDASASAETASSSYSSDFDDSLISLSSPDASESE